MNELIKINPDGKTTARELYKFLDLNPSQFSRWVKSHIIDNEFAEAGVDYKGFDINVEGNIVQDFELSISFAKKLCMLSKSERGNQAREYFLEVERRYQQSSLPAMTNAQLIAAIAQNLADQEQATLALSARTEKVERRLELVKDTIIKRDDDNWRENINADLCRIVKSSGMDYQTIKAESYRLLDERGRCDVATRLRNMRSRMLENGATKTAVGKLNKLDVIEQDPKLKEIYTSIVKELTIRYVA